MKAGSVSLGSGEKGAEPFPAPGLSAKVKYKICVVTLISIFHSLLSFLLASQVLKRKLNPEIEVITEQGWICTGETI